MLVRITVYMVWAMIFSGVAAIFLLCAGMSIAHFIAWMRRRR